MAKGTLRIATTNDDHLERCRKSKMGITWSTWEGKRWTETENGRKRMKQSEMKWNPNCIAHQIELKGGWKSSEIRETKNEKKEGKNDDDENNRWRYGQMVDWFGCLEIHKIITVITMARFDSCFTCLITTDALPTRQSRIAYHSPSLSLSLCQSRWCKRLLSSNYYSFSLTSFLQ